MGKRKTTRRNMGGRGAPRRAVQGGIGDLDTKVILGFTQNPPPVAYVTPITRVVPLFLTGASSYTLICSNILSADSFAYNMAANVYRFSTFRVNWIKAWGPVGKGLRLQSVRNTNDNGPVATDAPGYSTERARCMLKFGLTDSLFVYNKATGTDTIASLNSQAGGPAWVTTDFITIHVSVTFLS